MSPGLVRDLTGYVAATIIPTVIGVAVGVTAYTYLTHHEHKEHA